MLRIERKLFCFHLKYNNSIKESILFYNRAVQAVNVQSAQFNDEIAREMQSDNLLDMKMTVIQSVAVPINL